MQFVTSELQIIYSTQFIVMLINYVHSMYHTPTYNKHAPYSVISLLYVP